MSRLSNSGVLCFALLKLLCNCEHFNFSSKNENTLNFAWNISFCNMPLSACIFADTRASNRIVGTSFAKHRNASVVKFLWLSHYKLSLKLYSNKTVCKQTKQWIVYENHKTCILHSHVDRVVSALNLSVRHLFAVAALSRTFPSLPYLWALVTMVYATAH